MKFPRYFAARRWPIAPATGILCAIALLLGLSASAQRVRIVPLEEMKRRMPTYSGRYVPGFESFYSTTEPEAIDRIALRVTYDLAVRTDTLVRRDRVVAETGSRYTAFYSLYLRELSMNHTDKSRTSVGEWMRSCSVLYPEILHVDLRRRTLEAGELFPHLENLLHTYEEPLPAIGWSLDERATREIAGYRCLKARCSFRGRRWSVWYAPELPVAAGFWKLHGLPGMILAAEDDAGEWRFTAIGIEQPDEPMLRYRVPSRRMTRERVRKAARRLYDHPIDGLLTDKGQDYFVTVCDGRPLLVTRDQCAPIPYNPIELEP